MASPTSDYKLNENGIPPFEALPLQKDAPMHSAWGLYGEKDELGTLNRLTDERVAAAAKSEIRTGVRVSLNWPLDAQSKGSFFARKLFHQELFAKAARTVNDDVWTFNSQVSSQWDGLRHFAYQKEKKFYNGVTMDAIHGTDSCGNKSTVNGIQAWAEKGIVGRGILIDYHAWRLKQAATNPSYATFDPFTTTPIPLSDLLACLAAQGTEIHFGDILIIRSGWMVAHAAKSESDLADLQREPPHNFCGVEQSEEMLDWIWSNFSAVAGDQPSFECWPTQRSWALHEVLLAGWGCPIGELFDLEKLAEQCEREGRWSFFVASEVCNVPGGVASPPNILAIF
ncbi:hypothetical protein CONLIGDRAFT_654392 [Coniochaeta ligniaria NRRL 30616]|uniref:Cyclase n=1 Tax=Coniochaeta ligniaria NRRL 30616 TaxID=1408157 RepID=A0A1J7IRV5_9PEZI|nr:hypothetical protein CONLIGDRAFT_654392 [Coniochaeta ligniaria NRRL 30616]